MIADLPKISIVTPVYNAAEFIAAAIESVVSQEYPNLEYIVVDGGSTDGTVELIERRSSDLTFFVSEPDGGQTEALNKGFQQSTGDVLCWLNADEEYLEGTLLKIGQAYRTGRNIDLVFGHRVVRSIETGESHIRKYPNMDPRLYMLYGMRVLPTDATFWSRRVHELTGSLDEKRHPRFAMDYDWLLRMSFNVRHWKRIDEPLSIFTDTPTRVTRTIEPDRMLEASTGCRARCMEEHRISRLRLFFGWVVTTLRIRLYEGRLFRWPHLRSILRGARIWTKSQPKIVR
jgi:glycosyltransferase involved in cell wall biosynthesis